MVSIRFMSDRLGSGCLRYLYLFARSSSDSSIGISSDNISSIQIILMAYKALGLVGNYSDSSFFSR
jgi:hypothetical protein